VTKPLKWRSQLCPCGHCPPGTRIYWRHNAYELLFNLDVHFKPRGRRESGTGSMLQAVPGESRTTVSPAANPSSESELQPGAYKGITRKPVDSIGALVEWAWRKAE